MLAIDKINTGYSKRQILYDVSIRLDAGEIVALIGPNGAGKSTVLKAVHGLLPVWKGNIIFEGIDLAKTSPAYRVHRGITFCTQGRRVFGDLSVTENLEIGGYNLRKDELIGRINDVLELFPAIRSRRRQKAGSLSGGEQQQLAIARALITRPKLLLLDEPSLGLSPNLVGTVFEKIIEIGHMHDVSILIVEQKVREVLGICNRVYSMKLGKIAFEGPPDNLKNDKTKLKQLFL